MRQRSRKILHAPESMSAVLTSQRWDLVTSDYSMPHLSGVAALEFLKQSGLDLPIIIISAVIGEDMAVAAKGAAFYLTLSPFASVTSGKNEADLQSCLEVGL